MSGGGVRDVVVVGAGPAGSAAAITLAGQGHDVLVVERKSFPRWKVCGCCLEARALGLLEDLGLGSFLREEGRVLDRLRVHGVGRTVELAHRGRTMSRERLDAALADRAAAAGATFLWETRAEPVDAPARADAAIVRLHRHGGTESVRARLVVVASGLGAATGLARGEGGARAVPDRTSRDRVAARRIGLGATLDPAAFDLAAGTVEMIVDEDGYLGLVRLEDGRCNLAASIRAGSLAATEPADVIDGILRRAGMGTLPSDRGLTGTPRLRSRGGRARRRLVTVGDAAGFWEPFTGEGIGWALEAGIRLGPAAERLLEDGSRAASRRWSRRQRVWLLRRQLRSRAVAWLIGGRRRTALALWALERLPVLAGPLRSGAEVSLRSET